LGARLLFIVEEWRSFLEAPLDFILTGAGFTWYGGVAGGLLAATWVVRRRDIPWLKAADICAPALALAYGIGRIGCQIAGDGDWGPVSSVPWAMAYPNAIIGWHYPPGVRVHPTPVYETIQSLTIFAILWQQRKKEHPDGFIFWLYLVLSGLARFVTEFWRINPVVGFGLTEAQWIGLALALLGNYFLYQQRAKQLTALSGNR
jgi:phosphatidylglycerol:prolipoprotein diacylglycerol transferase